MSETITRLSRLAPAERARVLDRLRAEKLGDLGPAADALPPLVAAPRQGPVAASFWQEQLWYLDQLAPAAATYNVPFTFELDGPLDQRALAAALGQIERRHEILRTTFAVRRGRLVQVVAPPGRFRLPHLDLSADADPEAEARRRAAELAQTGMDLRQGPLYRTLLLRLDRPGRRHVLVWVANHAVADGWSLGVVTRELAALYDPLRRGDQPSLEELALQFADYSQWQRATLAGPRRGRLLDYWRRTLDGHAPLRLPTDFPRPPLQSFAGATHGFTVPLPLANDLAELSRDLGVTLFMTLLAAYKLLLARLCGQDDVTVATAVAGRTRPEIEPLIGSFMNTVALRTRLADDAPFPAFVQRVRDVTVDAFAHQELPFGKLVEQLRLVRDPSRNPICQTMFLLGAVPLVTSEVRLAPDLVLRWQGLSSGTVKFDLDLALQMRPEGLVGRLDYSTALFRSATTARWCDRYCALLGKIVDGPGRRLSEILPPGEHPRPETPAPIRSPVSGDRKGGATTATESALLGLWKEALGIEAIGVDDDFFVLGGYSLLAVRLVARIRRELGVGLRLRDFVGACTIAALAAVVDRLREGGADALPALLERVEQMSEAEVAAHLAHLGKEAPRAGAAAGWLLREPAAEVGARLFCFPYAGVGASSFHAWPRRLGAMEVCPVQLPGRENRLRDGCPGRIEDLAKAAAAALGPYLDRPFALFGHCMGALVAYALVVRLHEAGGPLPLRLHVSASRAPHLGFRGPLHPSMTDAQLARSLHRLVAGCGDPEPLPELVARAVGIVRKDLEICLRYRPPTPLRLRCPITAFAWRDDADVRPEHLAAWGEYGAVTEHLLAGDHYAVQDPPPALLAALEGEGQAPVP